MSFKYAVVTSEILYSCHIMRFDFGVVEDLSLLDVTVCLWVSGWTVELLNMKALRSSETWAISFPAT